MLWIVLLVFFFVCFVFFSFLLHAIFMCVCVVFFWSNLNIAHERDLDIVHIFWVKHSQNWIELGFLLERLSFRGKKKKERMFLSDIPKRCVEGSLPEDCNYFWIMIFWGKISSLEKINHKLVVNLHNLSDAQKKIHIETHRWLFCRFLFHLFKGKSLKLVFEIFVWCYIFWICKILK